MPTELRLDTGQGIVYVGSFSEVKHSVDEDIDEDGIQGVWRSNATRKIDIQGHIHTIEIDLTTFPYSRIRDFIAAVTIAHPEVTVIVDGSANVEAVMAREDAYQRELAEQQNERPHSPGL